MEIKCQFFGQLTDITNKKEYVIELQENALLSDLASALFLQFPLMKEIPLKYAIDEAFVQESHLLKSQEEVFIMPPFAGG